eukprot:11146502-Lingulodinium_polyedra.AAC.1
MGWSHAAWWCQRIHMGIVMQDSELSAGRYLHDLRAAPGPLDLAHTEYLDNFICLGQDGDQ